MEESNGDHPDGGDWPEIPPEEEFAKLEKEVGEEHIRSPPDFSSALQNLNQGKNRYSNNLANEQTRVKLQPRPNAKDAMGGNGDYINANFIKGEGDTMYIAAQAPIVNTLGDFWRMVWEQETRVVVMLTRLQENGFPKALRYWPKREGDSLRFGDMRVNMVREKKDKNLGDEIIVRFFRIERVEDDDSVSDEEDKLTGSSYSGSFAGAYSSGSISLSPVHARAARAAEKEKGGESEESSESESSSEGGGSDKGGDGKKGKRRKRGRKKGLAATAEGSNGATSDVQDSVPDKGKGKSNEDEDHLLSNSGSIISMNTNGKEKTETTTTTGKSLAASKEWKKDVGNSRVVVQIHFQGWPDFGRPQNSANFRRVLHLMDKYNRQLPGGATVAHCSAGLGRTGTLIAAHIALDRLRNGQATSRKDIQVMPIVRTLRKQRTGMVQSLQQYIFITEVVDELSIECLGDKAGVSPRRKESVSSGSNSNTAPGPLSSSGSDSNLAALLENKVEKPATAGLTTPALVRAKTDRLSRSSGSPGKIERDRSRLGANLRVAAAASMVAGSVATAAATAAATRKDGEENCEQSET